MLGTGAASRDQQTRRKDSHNVNMESTGPGRATEKACFGPRGGQGMPPPKLQRGRVWGVSVRHLSMAAEAKARRHQSGSGGSGDVAGVATGDDEEVELLAAAASYFSSRVFCLV